MNGVLRKTTARLSPGHPSSPGLGSSQRHAALLHAQGYASGISKRHSRQASALASPIHTLDRNTQVGTGETPPAGTTGTIGTPEPSGIPPAAWVGPPPAASIAGLIACIISLPNISLRTFFLSTSFLALPINGVVFFPMLLRSLSLAWGFAFFPPVASRSSAGTSGMASRGTVVGGATGIIGGGRDELTSSKDASGSSLGGDLIPDPKFQRPIVLEYDIGDRST